MTDGYIVKKCFDNNSFYIRKKTKNNNMMQLAESFNLKSVLYFA